MLALVGAALLDVPGWFNDFTVYYLAGRLVAAGHSPYDVAALASLGRSLGLDFVAGGGYSYPPPFAVAMVPLATLPFAVAVGLFTVGSVVAFAAAVAWWLGRVVPGAARSALGRRALLAAGAGLYPPVAGSVFAGQANLLVVALVGAGLAPFAPEIDARRGRAGGGRAGRFVGGVLVGLAAIVKLAPFAVGVPLALASVRDRIARPVLAGLVAGAAGSIALSLAAAPVAGTGAGSLGSLFRPDAFSTNQSVNGAISRLFLDGDRTSALLSGDPLPWIVFGTALLAVATAVLLLRSMPALADRDVVRLALALAIVAAALGAPKNSFWNHAPVVIAVALAIGSGGLVRTRLERVLVALWLGGTVLQAVVDRALAGASPPHAPFLTVASDAAAVALLALWAACGARLLSAARQVERTATSAASSGNGAVRRSIAGG